MSVNLLALAPFDGSLGIGVLFLLLLLVAIIWIFSRSLEFRFGKRFAEEGRGEGREGGREQLTKHGNERVCISVSVRRYGCVLYRLHVRVSVFVR